MMKAALNYYRQTTAKSPKTTLSEGRRSPSQAPEPPAPRVSSQQKSELTSGELALLSLAGASVR